MSTMKGAKNKQIQVAHGQNRLTPKRSYSSLHLQNYEDSL